MFTRNAIRFLVTIIATTWLVSASPVLAADLKAEDVVARHLDSLGTAQARAAAKTRVAEGTVHFSILVGGVGTQDGRQVFVSEGNKLHFYLHLPNPGYPGERFVCDGNKVHTADIRPGIKSNFGDFVRTQDQILKEGLWGGALSTAWSLLHLEERRAKLHYDGLKKVNDQELHELGYQPGKGSDLDIHLYFEPETFRHVLTVYSLTISPEMAITAVANAGQQPTRYRLEENFGDFKTFDGLTLPTAWKIKFTAEIPQRPLRGGSAAFNKTTVMEWDVGENQITNNVPLDARNFLVK
jgi:hypothetical protein